MSAKNSLPEKEENYLVLARRTRPQSFADLVGQETVVGTLGSMLSRNHIPHAFLFTGTRGVGKTSSARILAKSLCCEQGPTLSPCQICVHCRQITACSHDDVLEIDGASHTGVENIRELRESTFFYPRIARYKIFIIDEVHMLSSGAFNALLKTLEEPPPQVVFILATTELHKIPITVRSRCMVFAFQKVPGEVIVKHLKRILGQEAIAFEDDALALIAREAKGSLRDSLSILEQMIALCPNQTLSTDKVKNALGTQGEGLAEDLFFAICKKDAGLALSLLTQADHAGADLSLLVEQTAQFFRHGILLKSLNDRKQAQRLTQLLDQEYDDIQAALVSLDLAFLSEVFRLLSRSVRDIAKTGSPLAWAEIIVIDCIARSNWFSPAEALAALKQTPGKDETPEPLPIIHQVNKDLSTTPTQDTNDRVLFKKFVDLARQKSSTLASRLQHVTFDVFNKDVISFCDTPENEMCLLFTAEDLACFWDCLQDMGLEKARFQGRFIPKRPQTVPVSSQPEKIPEQTGRQQVTTATKEKRATPQQSLAAESKREKEEWLQQQEKKLLEKEHFRQLAALATSVKVVTSE